MARTSAVVTFSILRSKEASVTSTRSFGLKERTP